MVLKISSIHCGARYTTKCGTCSETNGFRSLAAVLLKRGNVYTTVLYVALMLLSFLTKKLFSVFTLNKHNCTNGFENENRQQNSHRINAY